MTPSGARPGRRALLAAGVLAATACARIPQSSGVSSTPVRDGSDPGAPYVQPRPPAKDAEPAQIVTGFVQAGVGAEDDYAVAREYLASDVRRAWDPRAGVTVYAGSRELEASGSGSGTVRLALQAVAQLDAHGSRIDLASASDRQIDLALVQEDGQWRIAKPPPGIFLSDAAFEILFTPGRLYHLDGRGRHLVPDLRWVPSQDAISTLLRHLTTGPAPHLAGAVASALPDGLQIPGGIRRGSDGTTRIELPASLAALPAERRGRALAQIRATVASLNSAGTAVVVSGGQELPADPTVALSRPLPGHRPIAAGTSGIVSLADLSGQTAPAQLVPALEEVAVTGPVIHQSLPLAAAIGHDGSTVHIAGTDASIPRRDVSMGGAVTGATVDDAGYVWVASTASPGIVHALDSSASAQDVIVTVPWLADREVRGLDLSADATRLLVVSDRDGSSRLDLCAVIRDEHGGPRALTEPRQIITGTSFLLGATWYDEMSVIVLGRAGAGGELRAMVEDEAGGTDELPPPRTGTLRVAGTAMSGQVLASTTAATLLRSDGSTWTAVGLAGRDPSFY